MAERAISMPFPRKSCPDGPAHLIIAYRSPLGFRSFPFRLGFLLACVYTCVSLTFNFLIFSSLILPWKNQILKKPKKSLFWFALWDFFILWKNRSWRLLRLSWKTKRSSFGLSSVRETDCQFSGWFLPLILSFVGTNFPGFFRFPGDLISGGSPDPSLYRKFYISLKGDKYYRI